MKKRIILGIVIAITIIVVSFFLLKDNKKNREEEKETVPPPTAPALVTALPEDSLVILSWQTVYGATSYNIYWSTQSPVTKANSKKISCKATRYVHTDLPGDSTYYYIVAAVNSVGESPASREVSAKLQPPHSETESAEPALENSMSQSETGIHREIVKSKRSRQELQDTDQPTWSPNDEVPPPWEEWPGSGEPTWDPNDDKPPPHEEWPGEGETPKWSPHDEPQRMETPF